MIRDYKVKRIHSWERFLLFFMKPSYICNKNERIYTKDKYKRMFNKTYILNRNISVERR